MRRMMGTRGITVGTWGITVGMRGISVGMWEIEWNRNRKKNEKKVYTIQFSFLPEIKKKTKLELS